MVEGMDQSSALTEEETELQQQVPEHLRLSYSRQQLLCLRAAKVDPCPLRCCENKGDEEEKEVPRTWDMKEAEQLEWEYELEKNLEEKKASLGAINPELRQMHRLQNETVRRLRQAVLEQEEYKQKKRERAAALGLEVEEEDEEEKRRREEVERVRQENLEIVREGGRFGQPFTEQRMHILEQLQRELDEEALTRKVIGHM